MSIFLPAIIIIIMVFWLISKFCIRSSILCFLPVHWGALDRRQAYLIISYLSCKVTWKKTVDLFTQDSRKNFQLSGVQNGNGINWNYIGKFFLSSAFFPHLWLVLSVVQIHMKNNLAMCNHLGRLIWTHTLLNQLHFLVEELWSTSTVDLD